jgi:hypothetical protein
MSGKARGSGAHAISDEIGQLPQRVVIHKSSRYWPAERRGFEQALRKRVQQYDLLAPSPQTEVRLVTKSQYPPLRSTAFSVDELDYLYTTGFISELNQLCEHLSKSTCRCSL